MEKTQLSTTKFNYTLSLFSCLFCIGIYILWINWPTLLIQTMHWQKDINAQLSELLFDAQVNTLHAGTALIGLSFVYGALHSLGPGHGKLIVSTYLATHPTKVKESLLLTIISGLLQAITAIALVSTLLVFLNLSMHEVNDNAEYFISFSFYAIGLLAVTIIIKNLLALRKIFPGKQIKQSPMALNINSIKKAPQPNKIGQGLPQPTHQHAQCGCGHTHFASAQQINQASSIKEYFMIVLSIGLRPCSGAIMVLIFSYAMKIYWLGILAAFAMAAGTILTTSTIAIMTITGKKLFSFYTEKLHSNHSNPALSPLLIRLSGGVILLVMAILLISAQPGLVSPIF